MWSRLLLKTSREPLEALGLAAVLLALAGPSCNPAPGPASRERVVVASIGPLADWARHVAGPRWEVSSVLPPGASEHTYEIQPMDVGRFAAAALVLQVGSGLDPFMDRLQESAGRRPTLVLTAGLPLVAGDPHVWLDPVVAREFLWRIAERLTDIEPSDSAGFRARAAAYALSLDSLDREYRREAAGFRVKRFVGFHRAWGYLARRYGLTEAGSVEEAPGREPGPADWARLVRILKETGARAVFAEPQFGERIPRALASDAGVRVLWLDPIGSTADPAGESYVTLMRRNLASLEEGLR